MLRKHLNLGELRKLSPWTEYPVEATLFWFISKYNSMQFKLSQYTNYEIVKRGHYNCSTPNYVQFGNKSYWYCLKNNVFRTHTCTYWQQLPLSKVLTFFFIYFFIGNLERELQSVHTSISSSWYFGSWIMKRNGSSHTGLLESWMV